jgi:hypothetical protein
VAGGSTSVGLVCGGGASVDGRAVFFWLSHVSSTLKPTEIVHLSSVGYLNLTEITVSFVGQLWPMEVVVLSSVFREADRNYFGR